MALYRQRLRRTRNRSAWIGGPQGANPPVDLDATTGVATAGGGTASVAFTWTATTGAATAGGGTASFAEGLTAAAGTATASGGTASVTVVLAAASGAATAGGGDATVTVATPSLLPGKPRRAARGLHLGYGRRAFHRRNPRRYWVLSVTATSLDLSATNGTATAAGGTADFSEGLTAATGTATAGGGTAALTVTVTAATGTATAGGGDATAGEATTPIPSLLPGKPRMRARRGLYAGRGVRQGARRRNLRRRWVPGSTANAPVNLTAENGTATASGTEFGVTWVSEAFSAAATAGGGTATVSGGGSTNLSATNGTATAAGGTSTLTVTWTGATGTATASGGTAAIAWTWTATTGAAAAAGGTATASSETGISATTGTATAGGGTAAFRIIVTAATGSASAAGGTVDRVNTATNGTATGSGGTNSLTWVLAAISGNATAGGGSAVSFVPTFGVVDGTSALAGVHGTNSLSALIDDGAVLAGIVE